ncbi:hypothetical protein VP01_1940g1 [Puccinia sorghi]|uniref:Uncharacterized protein n=1 Tax=Puccinia sorghi TaxID=27349 RepID=A0A0L6VE51_9BASI|nr:hypothetical protein VP01_1940g1 [Puccinia sorghi]
MTRRVLFEVDSRDLIFFLISGVFINTEGQINSKSSLNKFRIRLYNCCPIHGIKISKNKTIQEFQSQRVRLPSWIRGNFISPCPQRFSQFEAGMLHFSTCLFFLREWINIKILDTIASPIQICTCSCSPCHCDILSFDSWGARKPSGDGSSCVIVVLVDGKGVRIDTGAYPFASERSPLDLSCILSEEPKNGDFSRRHLDDALMYLFDRKHPPNFFTFTTKLTNLEASTSMDDHPEQASKHCGSSCTCIRRLGYYAESAREVWGLHITLPRLAESPHLQTSRTPKTSSQSIYILTYLSLPSADGRWLQSHHVAFWPHPARDIVIKTLLKQKMTHNLRRKHTRWAARLPRSVAGKPPVWEHWMCTTSFVLFCNSAIKYNKTRNQITPSHQALLSTILPFQGHADVQLLISSTKYYLQLLGHPNHSLITPLLISSPSLSFSLSTIIISTFPSDSRRLNYPSIPS